MDADGHDRRADRRHRPLLSGRGADRRIPPPPALDGASPVPLWLDNAARPAARPALRGESSVDLAVVGGGLTGLWTALRALERGQAASVLVLEADRIAAAASGRNGGFADASLTHGLANGARHFPGELEQLCRLGRENLAAAAGTIAAEGIDCGLEHGGTLEVATAHWQLAGLEDLARLARRCGERVELLDAEQVRARVHSPGYLGGVARPDTTLLVDPARLCWGLAGAIERRGGALHEATPVLELSASRPRGVELRTPAGKVRADHVALATSAFPPLVRRVRRRVLPVWDYVIATEPLGSDLRASLGWRGREGLADAGNQFHYYRLTPDDRVLFGGYDAVYYFNNGIDSRFERRPASFELLADHLVATFPQLSGTRLTHAWGGAIDTCSRFCAFFGNAAGGRAAYAAGFTGLGVGASRFAADVLVDLTFGITSERTGLELVRRRPLPFPPEPMRSAAVALTRRSLARADAREGKRNAWLRTLDRLGLGFDS